ncbi:hypothetical protein GCM10022227_14220 [Streptomyces sedi]
MVRRHHAPVKTSRLDELERGDTLHGVRTSAGFTSCPDPEKRNPSDTAVVSPPPVPDRGETTDSPLARRTPPPAGGPERQHHDGQRVAVTAADGGDPAPYALSGALPPRARRPLAFNSRTRGTGSGR